MSALPSLDTIYLSRNEPAPQGGEGHQLVLAIRDAERSMMQLATGFLEAVFPRPGTPEWGRMNQQRAELIRKEIRGELTWQEKRVLEILQRRTELELDRAYPRGENTRLEQSR